jgi:hypothetical protein
MVKKLALTIGFPLRRGIFQTITVLIYNGVVAAMLVTIIDTKYHFCIILVVLWSLCIALFVAHKGRRFPNTGMQKMSRFTGFIGVFTCFNFILVLF